MATAAYGQGKDGRNSNMQGGRVGSGHVVEQGGGGTGEYGAPRMVVCVCRGGKEP